jgi:hypothetical protein
LSLLLPKREICSRIPRDQVGTGSFFDFFSDRTSPTSRVNITARSSRPFGTEDAGLKTREEAGGPHDVASVMGDDYEEVRTSTFAL